MEILDVLAKMDERLARQDAILAQLATVLGRMDDRLAKQDDTMRHIDAHMGRLGEFMAGCYHEAAAAHQTTNVVMTRLAEQALALETTLQELRRERTRRR
jgi:ABC-type transporter Mla subunit MlaD